MSETILSLSEFRADASRLLDKIKEEPHTLVLTQNGRARAVVQDFELFQLQQRGLLMLKLMVQGEADVEGGRLIPQAVVFEALRHRLKTSRLVDE